MCDYRTIPSSRGSFRRATHSSASPRCTARVRARRCRQRRVRAQLSSTTARGGASICRTTGRSPGRSSRMAPGRRHGTAAESGRGLVSRELEVPASDAGRSIFLDIDGAMSYAAVWVNGQPRRRLAVRVRVVARRSHAVRCAWRRESARDPARQSAELVALVSGRRHLPQRVADQDRSDPRRPVGHVRDDAEGLARRRRPSISR